MIFLIDLEDVCVFMYFWKRCIIDVQYVFV